MNQCSFYKYVLISKHFKTFWYHVSCLFVFQNVLSISGEEEKFGDVSKSFRVKLDDQLITIPKRFEM